MYLGQGKSRILSNPIRKFNLYLGGKGGIMARPLHNILGKINNNFVTISPIYHSQTSFAAGEREIFEHFVDYDCNNYSQQQFNFGDRIIPKFLIASSFHPCLLYWSILYLRMHFECTDFLCLESIIYAICAVRRAAINF